MQQPHYLISDSKRVNRRSFLLATSSLAAAAVWSSRALGAVVKNPKFSGYPFQLGVASGDPSEDGFVLWTRLAPKPVEGGGMTDDSIEVSWQVAEDEAMSRIVKKGSKTSVASWAHSVHVEVEGLKPDRWYWYQFKAGGEVSQIGRTRTMPTANSTPDRLRFAFASCQHYETGFFTAYDHMAREGVDLVCHLGDYIYEGGVGTGTARVRKHNSKEIFSLEDYRNRHALYRSDASLQAMHAAAPWLVTWDDHEFDNNYAGPIAEEKSVNLRPYFERRADAYRAYYEHMPLRRSSLPKGPDMQLYRKIRFGKLAEFFVLDTRQYRSDQPCGDGRKWPCDDASKADATMLGATQRDWLFKGLEKSSAGWNVLAQQVMMARVDRVAGEKEGYSMDQWPGYEMERRRVLRHFAEKRIRNPVVLTGDIHNNWANELVTNFDRPEGPSVATEFVGTSISSGGDGLDAPKGLGQLQSENPWVKFHNNQRGYVRCEVTAGQWKTDFRVLDHVTKKDSPIKTRTSFVVESGRPMLNKA